jgi:hypothetical protein
MHRMGRWEGDGDGPSAISGQRPPMRNHRKTLETSVDLCWWSAGRRDGMPLLRADPRSWWDHIAMASDAAEGAASAMGSVGQSTTEGLRRRVS